MKIKKSADEVVLISGDCDNVHLCNCIEMLGCAKQPPKLAPFNSICFIPSTFSSPELTPLYLCTAVKQTRAFIHGATERFVNYHLKYRASSRFSWF